MIRCVNDKGEIAHVTINQQWIMFLSLSPLTTVGTLRQEEPVNQTRPFLSSPQIKRKKQSGHNNDANYLKYKLFEVEH